MAATASVMSTTDTQKALQALGWPVKIDDKLGDQTRFGIRCFQEGYAFEDLAIDGVCGPQTSAALDDAVQSGGMASGHFRFWEFASKGNGWIRVRRELLRGLEKVRDHVGQPVVVISGYRDVDHNRRVGGASNSRHMYGEACDLGQHLGLSLYDALGMRVFTGLGVVSRANPKVVHVDVGGLPSGSQRSGRGTIDNPSIWFYS